MSGRETRAEEIDPALTRGDHKEAPMASKLYVGGLSYSTTTEGLREFFTQCGTVESATVITDKFSGQSKGFGFVEMSTTEEAQQAIAQLNGRELDGRRLIVNTANPQGARTGGGRPGGGRPGGGFGDRRGGGFGGGRSPKPFRW
jgi:RNA recognition motif-containing protein